jgi:hypothetical protein
VWSTVGDDPARVVLRSCDDWHESSKRHPFATWPDHYRCSSLVRSDAAASRKGPMSGTTVTVAEDATALVLTITGPLDAAGGRLVHEAAAAALDAGDDRIVEVDLRGATPLTVDGLRALARCAAFGRIRFRFGTP